MAAIFENIRGDFNAHGRSLGAQGFWVLLVYRFGRWRYGVKPAILRKLCSLIYHINFKFVQILTGIELPCEVSIGHNFVIDHFGGIIVSGYAKFGDDCRIRNGVVVGLRRVEEKAAPVIGNNVDIGAGAKLLGPITIGDNCVIGANAVVLTDVPANSIAAGVPATIRPRRSRSPLSVVGGDRPAAEM
jgi:serine O-acetyltransferase